MVLGKNPVMSSSCSEAFCESFNLDERTRCVVLANVEPVDRGDRTNSDRRVRSSETKRIYLLFHCLTMAYCETHRLLRMLNQERDGSFEEICPCLLRVVNMQDISSCPRCQIDGVSDPSHRIFCRRDRYGVILPPQLHARSKCSRMTCEAQ